MRVKITLACTECKQRNYNTMKNKKNDPDRLEMNTIFFQQCAVALLSCALLKKYSNDICAILYIWPFLKDN